jgi:GGDEF domain-containing protein
MNDHDLNQELAQYDRRLRECEERIAHLQWENQQLQHDSIHDPQTALFSSEYFHARLQEEIVRSERYRHFLSLVLIHLELKNVYSTQQVTEELRRIGQEITMGLSRRTDILALYRRRQMIVLLPETDQRGAACVIHRFQTSFPTNGRRLNYAVLTYPHDASNIELVMNRIQEFSENLFRAGAPPSDIA